MTLRSHISSSILSLIISMLIWPAEGKAENKLETAKDSTALFKGAAVSVDLVGLGQVWLSDYGQYEAALRINLKDKYFPIVEMGYGTCDTEDATTSNRYKSNGVYGRLGCDFNILKNKHDIYRLYIGVRYAYASYKYDVYNPGITDPVWGNTSEINTTGVKGNTHWYEGLGGIDVKLAGPLRVGWSVRYRGRLAHKEGNIGEAWYVPGYGRSGSSRIGATFNVTLEL